MDVHELMEQIGPCGQWTDLQSISEIPKNIIPTEEAGNFIKFCSDTPFLLDEKKLNESVLGLLVISIEDGNLSNEVGAEKITSYQPTNGMDSRGDLVVGLWDKPTFSSSNYSNVGLHSKSE
ncbi:MAG: hypothetical protein H6751_15965 [Candidatus Omnitrophica bacterium]|nr:hypothetical protein [Candidatus Omnitrophota bacterium]